ncbi:RepB family plasmid replication initiator protein [Hymenobacter cheonanensis]|uniref:RepB family plasmid replication initiator protein n=1 Tax=Hymenobacter sp. CA2-7 TaxID=3063993 RepID=UPI002712EEBD|nr:RepB family plasmid replication initiator protein [Hymenobacter sp. CA2-7]MDO7888212.1 RepB family plasmid replication initiator protein [Hymenobacter sp. CA2-7]
MPINPYPGTTFEKTRGRWKAQGRLNGKTKSLGYFDTQEEAYAAVVKAKQDAGESLTVLPQHIPTTPAIVGQRPATVAQSNVLLERPWAMTLLEARIFVLLLQGLTREETDSRRIVVPLSDLASPTQLGGGGYNQLHAAMKGLDAVRIELPMPNRKQDLHLVPLVHSLKLDSGQGTLSGYFSDDVLPYLTNLVDNFTLGQVGDLLSIKSTLTHRFYWLLKSWEFRSPVTVQVDKLRELTTGLNTYQQFTEYRRSVLKPAVDELNGLNFDISYVEHKLGRSVDAVEFHIKSNVKRKHKQLMLPLEKGTAVAVISELTPLQQKVQTRLQKLKLTQSQIKKVLEVVVGEEPLTKLLKETYPVLRDFETKAKPGENVAAATMALLKSTFPAIWAAN